MWAWSQRNPSLNPDSELRQAAATHGASVSSVKAGNDRIDLVSRFVWAVQILKNLIFLIHAFTPPDL